MSGQPISPELARAWEDFFKQRGGTGPDVPAQILPVVLMDDNSRGPYPPGRPWAAGRISSANAGIFNYLLIINTDTGNQKSIVVVDEIRVRIPNLTEDDVVVGVGAQSDIPGTSFVPVDETSSRESPVAGGGRPLGNVILGQNFALAVALGNVVVPNQNQGAGGSLAPLILQGPWCIPIGAQLFIRPANPNEGICAYFRGRYYSAP